LRTIFGHIFALFPEISGGFLVFLVVCRAWLIPPDRKIDTSGARKITRKFREPDPLKAGARLIFDISPRIWLPVPGKIRLAAPEIVTKNMTSPWGDVIVLLI